jgi:hypothetical protein
MNANPAPRDRLPVDKGDVGGARALVEMGYPGVREVLPEIFEWLQDGNWPVFSVLAPFVASLGRVIVPHVKHVLGTNDEVWKYWVLCAVVRLAPSEVVDEIRSELQRISARPTQGEAEEELDAIAGELLERRVG